MAIRRENKDISRISTTLTGLGLVDALEGRFETATRYCLEALSVANQIGDIQSVGEAKLGLAEVAKNQHRCNEALRLATEALEHFRSLNETSFLRRDISKAQHIIDELSRLSRGTFVVQ